MVASVELELSTYVSLVVHIARGSWHYYCREFNSRNIQQRVAFHNQSHSLYLNSYSLIQRLDIMAEPLQLTAPNGTKYTQPTGK
jgi:hypothetical protein